MTDPSGPDRATPGPAAESRTGAPGRVAPALVRAGCVLLALATILAYHAVGLAYYQSFWIPQGVGMDYLLPEELAHAVWFFVFGLAAAVLLVVVFDGITVTARELGWVRRMAEAGRTVPIALGVFVFGASFLIAGSVLEHAVLTDDEHTYRFIAQTLRTGALTAPSPGGDLEFFRNTFAVVTDQARYGKYPIGHPLLLATGQLFGSEPLVVPLITALIAVPLFALGVAVFGRATALLGLLLFALSPQVLLTGATILSQPASALCLVTGVACLLMAETRGARGVWLAGAGTAFAYGVLVRPLPGVLFAVVAIVYVVVTDARAATRRRVLTSWTAFGLPLVLGAALMLWINRAQTGAPLLTGYHVVHARGRGLTRLLFSPDLAIQAMSLASHLARLNFWLLGWPLSLAFCVFARRTPRVALLWGMIAAAWAYRLLAPKAGVGATGPVYLLEIVPLLCLLSADGILQLAAAGRLGASPLVAARRVGAVVLAGTLVSASMFVPVKLLGLRRMAEAQLTLPKLVRAMGLTHALVFYEDATVPRPLNLTWAFYPRYNSPRLDDEVLIVRSQRDPVRDLEFWKRRFPDRRAWFFGYFTRGPQLIPFEAHVRDHAGPGASNAPTGLSPGLLTLTPAPGNAAPR